LARGGWLPFANRRGASEPTAMPELPGAIATAPDSAIEPPADSPAALAADSVGASDSLAMAGGVADTSVQTAAMAVPDVKQAGNTPATRPRDRTPATTPRAAHAARAVAVRRSAPPRLEPGKPVGQPATDSAAVSSRDSAELRMLREEITRRRARLDSLSRVVDSLRRTSPKPR
ncbi:MAG TPA: hypothetical protein VFZ21_27875, partial [Gemmatimonadaceae bacterium]|nr:hypothetical protein [Gemmatimonadaceae bacterium]